MKFFLGTLSWEPYRHVELILFLISNAKMKLERKKWNSNLTFVECHTLSMTDEKSKRTPIEFNMWFVWAKNSRMDDGKSLCCLFGGKLNSACECAGELFFGVCVPASLSFGWLLLWEGSWHKNVPCAFSATFRQSHWARRRYLVNFKAKFYIPIHMEWYCFMCYHFQFPFYFIFRRREFCINIVRAL